VRFHFYQRPPVLVRGEGVYLFDSEGRRYLDCFLIDALDCELTTEKV